jgi:hypothetical protein
MIYYNLQGQTALALLDPEDEGTTLVNTQNVSVTKTVDSSSIQCAESKYGLRILRIKPHFMYHDKYSQ